jgi:2-methylcitrate dehydratase
LPFCVAAALTDGEMTARQLTHARLRDPALHQLARRVRVTEDPEMTRRYPHDWPVEIEFRMRDGATFRRRIDQAKWSPRRPPTWAELVEKFRMMADPVLGAERADEATRLVAALDEAPDLHRLMELIRG